MATKKDAKAALIAERVKIKGKPKQTAADKKRLDAIAKELDVLKAEAFKRLAELRVTKAINSMRGLQKLSNTNNYTYTAEQVEKIIGALKGELEDVFDAFTRTGGDAKETFTL